MPDSWRTKIYQKSKRNFEPINDPVVKELVKGNTVVVETHFAIGNKRNPYKNLYASLALRGFRLQMHMFDDIDLDIYRALILWAEPLVVLWNCSRCGNFEVGSFDTKPQAQGCESALKYHSWRRIKNMKKKQVREEIAA